MLDQRRPISRISPKVQPRVDGAALARECFTEAGNDLDRAIKLVLSRAMGKNARQHALAKLGALALQQLAS
jgi:hypothetical protein